MSTLQDDIQNLREEDEVFLTAYEQLQPVLQNKGYKIDVDKPLKQQILSLLTKVALGKTMDEANI